VAYAPEFKSADTVSSSLPGRLTVGSRMVTKVDPCVFVKQQVHFCISTILKTVFLLLVGPACAFSIQESHSIGAATGTPVIYVVSHGWHTSIVLNREELPETIPWPEVGDFAGNQYIEVGWGDWDYYQAPDATWAMALKAAFWSTRSVLHIAGFNGPVKKFFPASDVIEVAVTEEGLKELSGFIARTHIRAKPESVKIRPGLYGNSRFYPAEGKFNIFHNCNTWVAEALRAGGLPIRLHTITAGSVMAQVRALIENADTQPGYQ